MVVRVEDESIYKYTNDAEKVVPGSPKYDPDEVLKRSREEAERRREIEPRVVKTGGRSGHNGS